MCRQIYEANFDGLVGPTHNYAGLSAGNLASTSNRHAISNPRQAALQGLQKASAMLDLGLEQGLFPPPMRPNIPFLHRLGFQGGLGEVLSKAAAYPTLLAAAWSASPMWAANAATVSASADSGSGKVNFTPANLISTPHRASETKHTARMLKHIFSNAEHFLHHATVPVPFGDEGAANHTRLVDSGEDGAGLAVFVYGREVGRPLPKRYMARQERAASECVARQHQIMHRSLFLKQSNLAIDAGVFHNDVAAVGMEDRYLFHERAYEEKDAVAAITERMPELKLRKVSEQELPLSEAVASYLFNSQLVRACEKIILIAPEESAEGKSKDVIDSLIGDQFVDGVRFFNLRESMRNGGGPACLRLRVPLTKDELNAVHPQARLNAARVATLRRWIAETYRDRVEPNDLKDPDFARESISTVERLNNIMKLGDLYKDQLP